MTDSRGRSRSRSAVLEFSIADVGEAVSAAPDFKAKVTRWQNHPSSTQSQLSIDDINRKLDRARQQRKARQQRAAEQRTRILKRHAARAAVQARRQTATAKERERSLRRTSSRHGGTDIAQLPEPLTEEEIETKLREAAAARESHLRQLAGDAHGRVQHAKQVAAAEREAAATLAASRLRLSKARMAAAAARREQRLREFSAAHAGRSPEAFLRANAMRIEHARHGHALRRLQAAWRGFAGDARPTAARVASFVATRIPGVYEPALDAGAVPAAAAAAALPAAANTHVVSGPGVAGGAGLAWQRDFDTLSAAIQAPATLRTARALLARLEALMATLHGAEGEGEGALLLRRLYPRAARAGKAIERYPARILLCAYMIQAHPDALFNGAGGDLEASLQATGAAMLRAFEAVCAQYLAPSARAAGRTDSVRNLLKLFDEAWVDFLEIFSTWRGADAASIEADLVRIAAELQSSMLAAVGGDTDAAAGNPQVAAIVAQVEHDQALLRARVARLRGPGGVARFDAAVAAAEPSAAARRTSLSPARSSSGAMSTSPVPVPRRRASGPGALAHTPVDSYARGAPSPLSPPRARGGAPSPPPPPAQPMPDGNETLMHELLLDPAFQLPHGVLEARWAALVASGGERVPPPAIDATAPPAALQQHVRMLAQDALVDAALQQLTAVPDGAAPDATRLAVRASLGQLLAIVAEAAGEVFASVPEGHAAHARRPDFEQRALDALLERAATLREAVAAVAGLLDTTVQLLIEIGAPGRERAARDASAQISAALLAAVSDASRPEAETHRAVAGVLARALRLLLGQLQVLKSDSANGRLTLLAATLSPQQALDYAATAFARRFGVPEGDVAEAALHAALPVTAEFAASSPSAEHVEPALAALRAAYGDARAAALPAQLRAGRVAPTAAAPPPPGSLLAEPLLLDGAATDAWQSRYRCALAALLMQPVDFAGNPAAPEVLRPYGSRLDAAKGLFQKSIVVAVCLRAAADARVAAAQPPLTLAQLGALERGLAAVEADSSESLLESAGDVVARALPDTDAAALASSLRAALAPGSAVLQAEAAELMRIAQALLIFGRCGGFSTAPGRYEAPAQPPAWAHALLQPAARLCMHAAVGEVAHSLARIAAASERAHETYLSKLF